MVQCGATRGVPAVHIRALCGNKVADALCVLHLHCNGKCGFARVGVLLVDVDAAGAQKGQEALVVALAARNLEGLRFTSDTRVYHGGY